jgi:predicted Zn-dependent peptidase
VLPLLTGAALLAVAAGAARAQAAAFATPDLPIDTFTLGNGLRVIVSEDHSTPLVAVSMWYRIGSAHEPPGRSGFAHLFEHLAFEETEHLGPGELGRLVSRAGGVHDATTNTDRTAYGEVLPSHRLNLALWLHAERMTRLRVTSAGLDAQRAVVAEERRRGVDGQPDAAAQLAVDTLAMRDFAPYRLTVIGSADDLDRATVADARAFYDRFYAPNHAVLAVVGDVEAEQVRRLADRYLGGIEPGPEMPGLPEAPPAPRSDGERRAEVAAPLARLPRVWMAYNLPSGDHPDHDALALLAQVFSTGGSSRLRERLVEEERVALEVFAQIERRRGPGLMLFGGLAAEGVSVERVGSLVDAEIRRLQEEGVSPRELERARNQLRAAGVAQRMTAEGKATLLQTYALLFGSPFPANHGLERLEAVTADDVTRVARTYLRTANRTVVVARPATHGGS